MKDKLHNNDSTSKLHDYFADGRFLRYRNLMSIRTDKDIAFHGANLTLSPIDVCSLKSRGYF